MPEKFVPAKCQVALVLFTGTPPHRHCSRRALVPAWSMTCVTSMVHDVGPFMLANMLWLVVLFCWALIVASFQWILLFLARLNLRYTFPKSRRYLGRLSFAVSVMRRRASSRLLPPLHQVNIGAACMYQADWRLIVAQSCTTPKYLINIATVGTNRSLVKCSWNDTKVTLVAQPTCLDRSPHDIAE